MDFIPQSQPDSQYRAGRERLCLSKCRLNISSDQSSWTIPSTCERKKTSSNCAVLMQFDVHRHQFDIYLTHDIRLNANQTFDNIIVQLLQFEFKPPSIQHYIGYLCAEGDDCHWLFVQNKIPAVTNIEYYQTLYNALEPLLYQSSSNTTAKECYDNERCVNCSNRLCSYEPVYLSNMWKMSRHCSQENETEVAIQIKRRRSDSETSIYSQDVIQFLCNINQCNSRDNEARINRTIQNYTQWIISIEKSTASSGERAKSMIIFLALIMESLYFSSYGYE